MSQCFRQGLHQLAQEQVQAVLRDLLQHREVHQDAVAGKLLKQLCHHQTNRRVHQALEHHAFQSVKVLHNISGWTWTKKRRKQLMLTWTTGKVSIPLAVLHLRLHLALVRSVWQWQRQLSLNWHRRCRCTLPC